MGLRRRPGSARRDRGAVAPSATRDPPTRLGVAVARRVVPVGHELADQEAAVRRHLLWRERFRAIRQVIPPIATARLLGGVARLDAVPLDRHAALDLLDARPVGVAVLGWGQRLAPARRVVAADQPVLSVVGHEVPYRRFRGGTISSHSGGVGNPVAGRWPRIAATSRSRTSIALRTVAGYHLAPPCAVGSPRSFNSSLIRRSVHPSARHCRISSARPRLTAGRPRRRPCDLKTSGLLQLPRRDPPILKPRRHRQRPGDQLALRRRGIQRDVKREQPPALLRRPANERHHVVGTAEPVDLRNHQPTRIAALHRVHRSLQAGPVTQARAALPRVLIPLADREPSGPSPAAWIASRCAAMPIPLAAWPAVLTLTYAASAGFVGPFPTPGL